MVQFILDHSNLFKDQSFDAAFNLGSLCAVDGITEVHRQAKQHLSIKLFPLKCLWLAILSQSVDKEIAGVLKFLLQVLEFKCLNLRKFCFVIHRPNEREAGTVLEEGSDALPDLVLFQNVLAHT